MAVRGKSSGLQMAPKESSLSMRYRPSNHGEIGNCLLDDLPECSKTSDVMRDILISGLAELEAIHRIRRHADFREAKDRNI